MDNRTFIDFCIRIECYPQPFPAYFGDKTLLPSVNSEKFSLLWERVSPEFSSFFHAVSPWADKKTCLQKFRQAGYWLSLAAPLSLT